ncbi:MAG: hypothetical protein QOI95_1094 [Acidimicrobiaceae bacterium]
MRAARAVPATVARARHLALAGVVGPVVFGLAAVIGATRVPGYSHVHNFVSELAAEGSEARVPMTIGFLGFGACILVFAWALRRLRPSAAALVAVVALSGIGTLMAGTFSCDEGCPTKGDISTHQQLHNVASVITFSAWIIAPLVAARQLRGSRFARVSLLLGLVELAFGLVLGSMNDHQPDDPVGLLQRIVLVSVAVWFVLLALELRGRPDRSPRLE